MELHSSLAEVTNNIEAFTLLTSVRCYLLWIASDSSGIDLIDPLRDQIREETEFFDVTPAWDRAEKWKLAFYASKLLK